MAPTGKSGSRWLDRLRTAKGFPSDNASNLENVIQNPIPAENSRHEPNPAAKSARDPNRNKGERLFTVSDVLHDLFNFGNGNNHVKLVKTARKQPNPKICALNVSDESNRSEDAEAVRKKKEMDDVDVNLDGFSKTEITVIDTSYEVWKFDKLLYRKKNLWKVRDKKGYKIESKLASRKKKKVGESKGFRDGLGSNDMHPLITEPEACGGQSDKVVKFLKSFSDAKN